MNDYLPLSYLNQLAYCPRRFWYMYQQGELEINATMLEGTFLHQRADTDGRETDDHGRTVYRHIWVWSDTLQIAGIADFVEAKEDTLIPVEYKHGAKGKWVNDHIQLCAQALCLEEMTGRAISTGEIFYWRSRRRETITLDQPLRQLTRETIQRAYHLLAQNNIPAPLTQPAKCQDCSIQPICLPQELLKLRP